MSAEPVSGPSSDRQKRRVTAGIVLVVVGLALFVFERFEDIGHGAVLSLVGAAFLVAYFLRRNYGLLVPGGILTGLGLGELGERTLSSFSDDPTLLGLGLGFLAIYGIALAFERRSHFWPLIPGIVLVLLALPGTDELLDLLFDNWPLLLAAIGVVLLLSGLRGRRSAG